MPKTPLRSIEGIVVSKLKVDTGANKLTAEKSPGESGTANCGALSNDRAVTDGASSLVQGIAKNGQENNRCNNRLQSEEVLDFGVRNAEERQLKQEVQQKSYHSLGVNTLIVRYVIRDVLVARPDGSQ